VVRAVRFGRALAERGQRDGRVGKHHDVPALSRFFPHEMHSVWTPAPPRPPKTVLSLVTCMAVRWGLAYSLLRWVATLVAVIWMKSLGTPPPAKMAAVSSTGGM